MKMIRWLNIGALLIEHKEEICSELIDLYNKGAITETAFCCTLVPEGNPALDKAAELGKRFALFQEALRGCSMPVGILLQATIGHGWVPDSPASFQKFVHPDGSEPYMFCPLDPAFREHITDAVRRLARLRPAFFMVDDDFRMYTGRPGCFCPLHLAEFNRRTGGTYSRETVKAAIDTDAGIAREYDQMLCESLVEMAGLIRGAVDETDPAIPGSFCTCEGDVRHAPSIARALAAPGQQALIRINNGLYMRDSARSFPQWLYRTAVQVAAMPEGTEVISEPDTCPHNRYSTSAAFVHAHNTFSILEGSRGGKLWLARLQSYEPASGHSYREILTRHAGFYRTLESLKPKWLGAGILMPETPFFNFPWMPGGSSSLSNWAGTVLGRMGLPVHFSKRHDGVVALSGPEVGIFSDDTLRRLFRGRVLLDGAAALTLCQRGFGDALGVTASSWQHQRVTFEMTESGGTIPVFGASAVVKLTPLSAKTQTLSRLFYSPFAFSPDKEELAPGATLFKNAAGGTVITLAGITESSGFAAFFMLNETRKQQLISLLNRLEPMPLYYPGDAEILLKAGDIPGGTLLAVLNVGLDVLPVLPLAGVRASPKSLESLTPTGEWARVEFTREPGGIGVSKEIAPLTPHIFRLTNE